jgi:glutathione S-transferase
MSLTFYFAPMSTASVTAFVLEELAIPVERVKLDLKKGDAKKPEFLALNPNARVPTLVHDGVPIWESAAITMYLGETFGVDKGLYPGPGPERGEAMKWIVWANVTLGGAVYRFAMNTLDWTPADQHNAKAGEAGRQEMLACLGILDRALEGKPYLLGDAYTLADTHVLSFVDWLQHMQVDTAPFRNVKAWHARGAARPAYVRQAAADHP